MQKHKGKQNQETEFTNAFQKHSDALFRHSYFRVSDRQVSIDLVHDAFTKTWIQITKGETILNFQSYLYHVLNNLIIDYYRKKKSLSLDALSDGGFEPEGSGASEIEAQSEHALVMRHLEKLPERDRDVVVMRYIDGLQVKQIASVIGEEENNVSVRLHRAVKKLKSYFNQDE